MPSWRGLPPEAALDWVTTAVGGGRILAATRLRGGGWLSNHAITIRDRLGRTHHLVLRRRPGPGWDVDDPDFSAAREVVVLGLLDRGGLPAPRVIAADPEAAVCDVPAVLITRIPGHPPRAIADLESFLAQLAEMLVRIHGLPAGGFAVPAYRTYVAMRQSTLPAWLHGDALWQRALTAACEAEAGTTCFIHRDYHPGNSLWMRGRLTGVVDWTQASMGPAEVDVGHMRWNLAADHGLAAADRFQDLYVAAARRRLRDQPRWDLVTLMDLVLDMDRAVPETELAPLRRHAAACLDRLESGG